MPGNRAPRHDHDAREEKHRPAVFVGLLPDHFVPDRPRQAEPDRDVTRDRRHQAPDQEESEQHRDGDRKRQVHAGGREEDQRLQPGDRADRCEDRDSGEISPPSSNVCRQRSKRGDTVRKTAVSVMMAEKVNAPTSLLANPSAWP